MQEFDSFYLLCFLVPLFLLSGMLLLYKFRRSLSFGRHGFLLTWNTVFFLLLLSVVFFAGESYFRFFVDTTDSFGLNKITQRWMERHYKWNNFNVRDNVDYALTLRPGTKRITFLGDSFTAGHGIKDVDNRFANIIRSKNRNLEIQVMAYNGMESIDELELVQNLIAGGYQFDEVVLVYNLNDISYLLPETKEIYARVYSFNDHLGYFGRHSYFVNTLLFRYFALLDPDIMNYYDFVEEGYFTEKWEQQAQVLTEMEKLIRQAGGKLTVVTFPFLHDPDEAYKFQAIHDKLGKFWSDLAVPHIDLSHVFAGQKKSALVVNRFDAHPNELANRIVAAALDDAIKSRH